MICSADKAGIIINRLTLFPTGAGFFAAAGKFIDRRPSAGFRRFYASTFILVAGLNVCGLTFLFVGVAGFIALGHDEILLVADVLPLV